MGRPRKHRLELPERVYYKDGRYQYVPKEGKPVELGSDLAVALTRHRQLVPPKPTNSLRFLGEIGDAYMEQIVPLKGPGTQRSNKVEWKFLRPAFAHLLPEEISKALMYKYMAARGAIVRANREKALLSHMLSWCVFLGKIENNPLLGMQKTFIEHGEPPRTRLVTDKELEIFKRCGDALLVAYVELKDLIRARQGDLLTLKVSDLKDEGIEMMPRKSRRRHPRTGERIGKRRIFAWTPELRAVVARILELKRLRDKRTHKITPWLFATRNGKCYYNEQMSTAYSFHSLWHGCMTKAIAAAKAEGWVLERFTEHDLRARAGGNHKLLGNTEAQFNRTYDRVVELVEPLRKPDLQLMTSSIVTLEHEVIPPDGK